MSTDAASEYRVEPLSEQHERSGFASGVEALDAYFRTQAGQDARRCVASPFVLVERRSGAVAGYYTLSNTAVDLSRWPPQWGRKLPRYPLVPATLLGRLAVDQRHQGRGLGEVLLLDALRRALQASRQVASFAVVVEAKDAARAFYDRYGFIPFTDLPSKLFLPMTTIVKLFSTYADSGA